MSGIEQTSWKEFGEYLLERGFKLAHAHDLWEYDFPQDVSPKKTDEFQLWCKKDEGLIVCANSYESRVNDARLHFELRLPVPYDQLSPSQYEVYSALVQCRSGGGPLGDSRTHLLAAPEYDLLKSWSLDRVCDNVRNAEGFSFNVPWEGRLTDHNLNLCERLLSDLKLDDFYQAHQFIKLVELRLVSILPDDVKQMIGYGR